MAELVIVMSSVRDWLLRTHVCPTYFPQELTLGEHALPSSSCELRCVQVCSCVIAGSDHSLAVGYWIVLLWIFPSPSLSAD